MNKMLIFALTLNLFIAQISAQTFFEKYYKEIYGGTIVAGLFIIFKLWKKNTELRAAGECAFMLKSIQSICHDCPKIINQCEISTQTDVTCFEQNNEDE